MGWRLAIGTGGTGRWRIIANRWQFRSVGMCIVAVRWGHLNVRGIFGGDSEREVWGKESISVRLPDYLFGGAGNFRRVCLFGWKKENVPSCVSPTHTTNNIRL